MDQAADNFQDFVMRRPDRRRLSTAAVSAHSQRVKWLRLIVPAIGAGVLMTYALSATPPVIDKAFMRDFANIDTDAENMRLNRPRHTGYDLEGNPFEIAAASALRNPETPGLISLDSPQAFRGLENDEDVTVRALRGLMDTEAKRLDLSSSVELDHRIGGSDFTLNTDAAEVDFENKTIKSVSGVSGSGDRGTVAADSMTVYQDEGRAVFEGNVQFQIAPAKKKDDDTGG
ncbi:LPS export ABC transporter periplasmic protein LptC [Parvularcula marina]|uniref:LPS export ABC transporter periplasmic protein LptC n=1 Tax=Parvularcula marina TaxID=2292771 RepID=A0A371RJH0_9PROT|nr:LPS export ABC transporter periplasmic protein LptC [Parvularcula marina]RFB05595.1 LPS export ABC transporter periplasmic protein LptC [Parvularcula marina]